MSSSMVPMKANFHTMSTSEFQFYQKIASGNRPTDSHNLYVRIITGVWHIWYNIFGIFYTYCHILYI